MDFARDPKWLQFLSRRLRWMAIPNIATAFVAIQAVGYLFVASNPAWVERLALIPSAVFEGQIWRLVSFLAIPVSLNLIGILFSLLFGFFILNSIENEWGDFKTTFYVLSSVLLTIFFSLVFGYPVTTISGFVSTWFLAAATLFPDREIHLYFLIPVKMKYLGWIAAAFVLLNFFRGAWMDRLYLITIYANYFLFFGPYVKDRWNQWQRRRRFKSQIR